MTSKIRRIHSVLVLVALGGCEPDRVSSNTGLPSAPGTASPLNPAVFEERAYRGTLDDQFEALDRDVGGFGGLYHDESGRVSIYLKPGVDAFRAVGAIRAALPGIPGLDGSLSVRPARFGYSELASWRRFLASDAVDRTGLVFDDIDERVNRLTLGVLSAEAGARLEQALIAQGVPRDAIVLEITTLPRLALTLNDTINPTLAGIVVNGAGGCTLGFNVRWNGVMHFVTASHCTSRVEPLTAPYPDMGVVTGLLFCQRSCGDSTVYPGFNAKLGPEVIDPAFHNTPGYWGSLCASDELCRLSDAAMIRYDYRIPSIFELAGNPYWGSLDIISRRQVIGEVIGNNQTVGSLAQRTGRSTGWQAGWINRTCFHLRTYPRPNGKVLKLVCQNEMEGEAQGGDSGEPVWYGDINGSGGVSLLGIVFGGRYVPTTGKHYTQYSPINNIQTDFGWYWSWQTY